MGVMAPADAASAAAQCPTCRAEVSPLDSFCENCGATLTPSAVATAPDEQPLVAPPCVHCGATVADDGYCTVCGSKALTRRDHWDEQPAPWIAGVCDKGIVHARNEDAMSLVNYFSAVDKQAMMARSSLCATGSPALQTAIRRAWLRRGWRVTRSWGP